VATSDVIPSKPSTQPRAAIYGRVSTRDKGQDVENQLAQLREFARRQGWEITREYTDEASGSTSDRDQFQAMFQDASQRKFDVLLFWSLDRLSREGVLPTLQHLTRLSDYGLAWRSYTEQYLDSTGIFRDAVIGILAAIARQEKIRIQERTRAGLERARLKGIHIGRPRAVVDVARVKRLRASGIRWREISEMLSVPLGTLFRAAACSKSPSAAPESEALSA